MQGVSIINATAARDPVIGVEGASMPGSNSIALLAFLFANPFRTRDLLCGAVDRSSTTRGNRRIACL